MRYSVAICFSFAFIVSACSGNHSAPRAKSNGARSFQDQLTQNSTATQNPGWPATADVPSQSVVYAEIHAWSGTAAIDKRWHRWNDTGHDPSKSDILSTFWPASGLYSPGDCAAAAEIGNNLKAAGVDVALINWLGGSTYPGEQERMETLLKCVGMKVAIQVDIEPAWTGENFAQAINRLEQVISWYSRRKDLFPNYYRDPVSGYPIYFIWDPASVARVEDWNAKISYYKQNTPEHGIFVAGLGIGGTTVEWVRDSKFDGLNIAAQGNDGKSDQGNFEWALYLINAFSDYRQFIVGWSIPGFDNTANCDGSPIVVPRNSGQVFDQKWQGVLSAAWNGNRIHSAYVPYHNDGEDAGIEPVSPNPPVRAPDSQSCGGRLSSQYKTYAPLAPTYYLERNAYWASQFKKDRNSRPDPESPTEPERPSDPESPITPSPNPTEPESPSDPVLKEKNYAPTSIYSNDVLPNWPANHAMDGVSETSYSSNYFPTSTNDRGVILAAWINPKEALLINTLKLKARFTQGILQAFPLAYDVYVTNPQNTDWVYVGHFTTQPDENGTAVVDLGETYATFGAAIIPSELGMDSYGNHYLQMADFEFSFR